MAIFIIQKILLDDLGLGYICQTSERFSAVIAVLNNMAQQMSELKSLRLIKHIIRCYLRLTDDPKYTRLQTLRALQCIANTMPDIIKSGGFFSFASEDSTILKYSTELRARLEV